MLRQNNREVIRGYRLYYLLPPTLLVALNIFFFTPALIYIGNSEEFSLSLTSIILEYIFPSLTIIGAVSLLGLTIPASAFRKLTAILFAIGVLIWLQGNILVWDYGVFGKADIDWSKYTWQGWVDTPIWFALLVIAVIFSDRLHKVIPSTSLILIILQSGVLVLNTSSTVDIWKQKISQSRPMTAFYEYSKNTNVIHVILDELQSDIFQEIINSDSSHYYNVFNGFTFYRETAGSFPTTVMSVPAYLSGQVYQSNIPIQNFIDTVYTNQTIPNILYDHGYGVDLAAEQGWYSLGKHTNWFYIPVPYGVAEDSFRQVNATYMQHLVAFRVSPHFLKPYFQSIDIDASLIKLGDRTSYEALRHFSQQAFLQDLIDSMAVTRHEPVYKLIHLTTTHWPMVFNENCEYAGSILPYSWENIRIQAKCSLDHFIQYLERLKQLKIYDSALIVIHADHGYWKVPGSINQIQIRNVNKPLSPDFTDEEDLFQKVCASAPMLAIKLPNASGPLAISDAHATITDIPATISDILKLPNRFPGQSILNINSNDKRYRYFYYYYELNRTGENYFHRIDEYEIYGSIRDRTSWKYLTTRLPSDVSTEKIEFGTDASGRYLRYGWSFKEMDPDNEGRTFIWAVGDSASIFLPLPKHNTRFSASVRSPFGAGQQAVSVFVNGKKIGGWVNQNIWTWETHSLDIGPDSLRPSVSQIDFHFSKVTSPTKNDKRRLALLFENIMLN